MVLWKVVLEQQKRIVRLNEMDELVSIITPAYNSEKYIAETIESVLNQTYKNWEMIIIDDCSTDKTSKLVNDYILADSRIKLVSLNKNGGVSNARNIGLSKARGAFVAFLDSDDIWVKNKLETQILFMKKMIIILHILHMQNL